jgi:hypothetical protein
MRKQLILASLISLFLVSSVFAWVGQEESFKVVQKIPSDWSIVAGGYSSTLFFNQLMTVQWVPCGATKCKTYVPVDYVSVVPTGNVQPNTEYTLIYYGDATNNDVWPYATCIVSGKSSSVSVKEGGKWVTKGYLSMQGQFKWTDFIGNKKAEKFWVVPTKDLDCANHKFIAWNPLDYLFETKLI